MAASRSSLSGKRIHKKKREQSSTKQSGLNVEGQDSEANYFNLGKFIGAIQLRTPDDEGFVPVSDTDRFIDILEAPDGYEAHEQVESDEQGFVVRLQAQIPDADINPEEQDRDAAFADKAELHRHTFARLSRNMDVAEQVPASYFWHCACMHHQNAEGFDQHLGANAFHLGELIRAVQGPTPHDEAYVPCSDRFLDLEEAPKGREAHERALATLSFSITLADPLHPDCPVVACSEGFTALTGYHTDDVIGKSCWLPERAVPCGLLHKRACVACRALCAASACGTWLSTDSGECLVDQLKDLQEQSLAAGEVVCVQTNAKSNGELFLCMLYLKQVELDNECFVLGLQAPIPDADINPEEHDQDAAFADEIHHNTFTRLSRNMDVAEQVLASHFWYCAGMRRQIAEGFDQNPLQT